MPRKKKNPRVPTQPPPATEAPAPTPSPAPTPAPTPTPPAGGLDPSGVPVPIGDLPGWRQIFTDNFPTDVALGSFPAAVSSKWWAYPEGYPGGWKDSPGKGWYSPQRTVSISNGTLKINLHTERVSASNGTLVHWVAALVPQIGTPKNGQLYGRYAVRFRVTRADAGYKMAWLTWPDSETWPRDGELDFPEGDLRGTISGYMHRQGGTSAGDQDAFETGIPFGTGWHTVVTEWTPGAVRYILDGQVIGTSTNRIPNTPMHYVIQNETSFSGEPTNAAVGGIEIDWVALWKYAP